MQHETTLEKTTLATIAEAIQLKRVIMVTYNGERLQLNPHQLFARHHSVYLRAFNPAKSLRHDEDPTLGNFNIAGMSDIDVTTDAFEPLASFDAEVVKAGDNALVSVDD
ncbi:WYL domain-containing protein [Aurantiacibacter rhizosphaerae]|uniref:WYL domain-containing protein n=1 Tax=Aurantiacibacter rhizosphaerae TaxID=2691582 RepID=A0A844XDW3_9SPHN|nr:WYL domain-containing protein [Aurantiacibacter rhizosphaerae]MWV28206.1 WYL domain-containing protein [Aurantiacibacter rhizosphaerae]